MPSSWSPHCCETEHLPRHGLPAPLSRLLFPPAKWSNINLLIDASLVGMVDATQNTHLAAGADDRAKYLLMRRKTRIFDIPQQKHGIRTLSTHCQGLHCSFVRTQALQKEVRSGRRCAGGAEVYFHLARKREMEIITAGCSKSGMRHIRFSYYTLLLYPNRESQAETFEF